MAIFAAILLFCAWFTLRIRFSYNYEDFFPQHDPDLDFYYSYRAQFEHDDNFFLVGFKPGGAVFSHAFLTALDTATQRLAHSDHIEKAYSISNFRYFVKSPFGFLDYPALHIDDSSRYAADSARMVLDERIRGKLISPDMQTVVIFLKTADDLDESQARDLVNSVHTALQGLPLPQAHFLGKANFQVALIDLQQREFLLYSFLSLLLVCAITYFLFRKAWCVFLSLLTVGVTLLLFTGIIGISGLRLNVMGVLYPVVIIVIGISDAVHFLNKYIHVLREEPDREKALFLTLSDVGLATFLTALTSAIGFLTLVTANVQPLRVFGLFSGLGILLAYFVVIFLTCPLLKLFSPSQLDSGALSANRKWNRFINFIYLTGKNKARRVVVITTIVTLIFGYGLTRISTDIHVVAGLPRHSVITDDFTFFENNFNGFRPFEIAAIAQDTCHITDPEVLTQIGMLEKYAAHFPIVNGLQSVDMVYKSLNRAYHGDNPAYYALPPDTSALYASFEKDLSRFRPAEINVLLSKDRKLGRISGFLKDAGTDSIREVQNAIMAWADTNLDTSCVHFRVTGTGIIFDKNTEYLRHNIISGVLLAFITISILMALMFRNFRMVFISIIPNIIPLIVCAGIMGFMHIELDAPTSIIFDISYGIAVDDTIHFLSKYKIERSRGASLERAIHTTFQETGKSIFVMSLILMFGFLILLFSSMTSTFNIGLLTGLTLFSAVWPDVFLLPVMLRAWMRHHKS